MCVFSKKFWFSFSILIAKNGRLRGRFSVGLLFAYVEELQSEVALEEVVLSSRSKTERSFDY